MSVLSGVIGPGRPNELRPCWPASLSRRGVHLSDRRYASFTHHDTGRCSVCPKSCGGPALRRKLL
jgi:hypothetical protein